MRHPVSHPALLLLAALAVACGPAAGHPEEGDEYDPSAAATEPIIGGSKATAYATAALIDMYVNGQQASACSGAVIAPQVVLTAGHCIAGVNGWKVTTPYAGKQSVYSTKAWTGYKSAGSSVNPNTQDVGLVFLDKPITLSSYPLLAGSKQPNGTKGVNVGRINNGQFSSTDLFASKPLTLSDATSYGFPYDYIANEVIQPGDSGGPVFLAGSGPQTIVAVNSGAGGGTEVLARVDLLAKYIEEQINQHGGPGKPDGGGQGGAGGSSGAGGSGTAGSGAAGGNAAGSGTAGSGTAGSGTAGAPPSPGACPGGKTETEPNHNGHGEGLPGVNGVTCGSLSSGADEDWFLWGVGNAGIKYAFELEGEGAIVVWKLVGGSYYPIPNQQPTYVSNVSSGPGTYYVAVYSETGAAGAYKLHHKAW